MKKIHEGTITNIKEEAKNTWRLVFSSDVKEIEPGQFISILCPPKTLRRPFGVVDFSEGKITILFRLRGEGTNYLRNLKVGDKINFNAPLGKPFIIENKKSLLIGAGIGIAPLFYLNKKMKEKNIETMLIGGYNTQDEIIKGADYDKIGGSILDVVPKFIEDFKPEVIYSCAPQIVLKLLSKIGQENKIKTYVAMERVMACGIGVCRGCVIKIKKENVIENKTVCHDGPVFLGDEVIWE